MLDNKFVPQFNITLRCNMYNICKYCYIKEQEFQLPLDLDYGGFSALLDWFIRLGVDEIILLGGEPTLHPSFMEFLDIVNKKKVYARLFTNGTFVDQTADLICRNKYIKTIFFHYDENYLKHSEKVKERFFNNLEKVFKSKKQIWIRWNIDSTSANFSKLIPICKQYAVNIGYSISVPTLNNNSIPIREVHRYADNLIRFIKSAKENNIEVQPARAIPLCAFDDNQLDYLKKNGNLQGNCIAINDITINTDLSIQLCSVTHPIRIKKVSGLNNLKETIDFLKGEERRLQSEPAIPECNECNFFSSGECQGGCYGYKLYSNGIK